MVLKKNSIFFHLLKFFVQTTVYTEKKKLTFQSIIAVIAVIAVVPVVAVTPVVPVIQLSYLIFYRRFLGRFPSDFDFKGSFGKLRS